MAPNEKNLTASDEIPSWLNEDYFHDILRQDFGSSYKINNFLAKKALGKGENYTSTMVRVEIDLTTEAKQEESISYIVKIAPDKDSRHEIFDNFDFFSKEIDMYTKIIPKFKEILKTAGNENEFFPKCLKTTLNRDVIVMEDLKKRSFINKNRLDGLDFEHVKAVLLKLAKFHAISVCLHEKENLFKDPKYYEGIFTKKFKEHFREYRKKNNELYKECILKWRSGSKYVDRIIVVRDEYCDAFFDALEIDWTEFNVLNHGDLWSNNIMFQHNESGEITETYFVDLQGCKWGSPAQDLFYFLISSCSHDIKTKYFDFFIEFYYNHLIENLKCFQFSKQLPSLKTLQNDITRRGVLAIAAAFGVLTAVLLDPTDDATVANYLNDDEKGNNFKRKVFTNPRYVRDIEMLLPFFEDHGFID